MWQRGGDPLLRQHDRLPRSRGGTVVNEQKLNPFVEAKMTYRLDRLVERQAEFNLDFPIFLMGGIGTDFEFYLEEVRRKVGSINLTPILLFGERSYWEKKITSNFRCNLQSRDYQRLGVDQQLFLCGGKCQRSAGALQQVFPERNCGRAERAGLSGRFRYDLFFSL